LACALVSFATSMGGFALDDFAIMPGSIIGHS
jgi:hypothetical protein